MMRGLSGWQTEAAADASNASLGAQRVRSSADRRAICRSLQRRPCGRRCLCAVIRDRTRHHQDQARPEGCLRHAAHQQHSFALQRIHAAFQGTGLNISRRLPSMVHSPRQRDTARGGSAGRMMLVNMERGRGHYQRSCLRDTPLCHCSAATGGMASGGP